MLNWRENFVSYDSLKDGDCYIYCDTNASYASIHQHLEDGFGKPCVVANGNSLQGGNAGACLAISYEARGLGIGRGASVRQARSRCKDLIIYESCLPLYDIYADLYDKVLEWIIPKNWFYRGSCDEVIIHFSAKNYPYKRASAAFKETLHFIHGRLGLWVPLNISEHQRKAALLLEPQHALILAVCYLIRDVIRYVLGLPISLSVAPSIQLAKVLIDQAKPTWSNGTRVYQTLHDAISFPLNPEDSNTYLRKVQLKDLCGVRKVAKRISQNHCIHKVSQIQDHCGLDRVLRLAANKHLGEVIWYACHGRDDVLPAYLASIRDRK